MISDKDDNYSNILGDCEINEEDLFELDLEIKNLQ
jgi:hypothetical protein